MWSYEKRLQHPVKIDQCNPKLAMVIMSQFGGPDGELAASMRYLSQRYAMPNRKVAGLLTDIGTEELAHRCYRLLFSINLGYNCNSKSLGLLPLKCPDLFFEYNTLIRTSFNILFLA